MLGYVLKSFLLIGLVLSTPVKAEHLHFEADQALLFTKKTCESALHHMQATEHRLIDHACHQTHSCTESQLIAFACGSDHGQTDLVNFETVIEAHLSKSCIDLVDTKRIIVVMEYIPGHAKQIAELHMESSSGFLRLLGNAKQIADQICYVAQRY